MQETQLQKHCLFISPALCSSVSHFKHYEVACPIPDRASRVSLQDSEGRYGLPQKSQLSYLCTSIPHDLGKSRVRNRPLIHRGWSCKHIPMAYAEQLAGCSNFKCYISVRKFAWILLELVVTKYNYCLRSLWRTMENSIAISIYF